MSGGPGSSGGSNPRKFSEKIALHNQKQAEETRAFEQLMTDLTVSRVQFQKVQQLRLSQSRGQYIGGSLPNVNQICNTSAENQAGFPQMLDPRGTRHHGLVHRSRISSPHSHRRTTDKHRHCESSPYSPMYLSPPPDHNWRRTNSDSALHTSVMNPQEGFHQRPAPPLRNSSVNEAEVDGSGDIFSFPPLNEENMMGMKPLPKQLWEAKKVQSLALRPKSCEVPGINIFPSPDQPMPQPQYPPCLNSGLNSGPGPGLGSGLGSGLNPSGSLPDLTNLHFPSPLSTPLDSEEHYSHHQLPHAMMQMGLSSSLSNPSLCSSPRRRPTPISPLTLSPEQRRGAPPTLSPVTQGLPVDPSSSVPREPPPPYPLYQQSHTAPGQQQQQPPASGPNQGQHQGLHQQPVSPLNSPLSAPSLQRAHHHQGAHQGSPLNSPQTLSASGHQTLPPLQSAKNQPPPQTHQNLQDYSSNQNMSLFGSDPFMEAHFGQNKSLPYQFDGFNFLDGGGSGNCSFEPPSSSSSSLFYNPPLQHHNNMNQPNLHHNNTNNSIPHMAQPGVHNQSSAHTNQGQSSSRPPFLFPNAALPNIILTDDSGGFSLEEELRIEPLSLDGLSMLSDPDLVLPDPTVEDSFRSDRL